MFDAWMFVAKDKSEALFTFVQVMGRTNYPSRVIKLKGLDPERMYRIEETGQILSGRTMMHAGIVVNAYGDYSSQTLYLCDVTKVEE